MSRGLGDVYKRQVRSLSLQNDEVVPDVIEFEIGVLQVPRACRLERFASVQHPVSGHDQYVTTIESKARFDIGRHIADQEALFAGLDDPALRAIAVIA